MPWCPHCDEVFPEGPACPRCRAALVEVQGGSHPDDAQLAISLPPLKVPRRMRRAMRTQYPTPPRHLIGFSMALVLLAGGFVLGRMSGVQTDSPGLRFRESVGLVTAAHGVVKVVRVGPGAAPVEFDVAVNALKDGRVSAVHRFTSPHGVPSGAETVALAGLRRSLALRLDSDEGRSMVAAFPATRAPLFWLEGDEAAWASEEELLVRRGTGVRRWTFAGGGVESHSVPGAWRRLFQTATGSVLEEAGDGARSLVVAMRDAVPGPVLPAGASVVAVASDGTRAFVNSRDGLGIMSGSGVQPVDLGETLVLGAAFAPSGDRVAVVVAERGHERSRRLAVIDERGERIMLRPLPEPDDATCRPVPVWDDAGRWTFVAPGDGSVQAFEIGGVTKSATLRHVGCTLAWGV